MSRLRALIAEDEPLARERLSRFLQDLKCEVVAEVGDGLELVEWIRVNGIGAVDVLFLDIQMPSLTGMEALAELQAVPPTVFVTAHKDYAVDAWNTDAYDFILKPVFPDRLEHALQGVEASKVKHLSPEEWKRIIPPLQQVSIKAGKGWVYLNIRHINYFELADEKVWAYTSEKRGETPWTSLREVEAAFPEMGMIRIQRHLLLRPEAVLGCAPVMGGRLEVRLPKGVTLTVSRDKVLALRQRLAPQ